MLKNSFSSHRFVLFPRFIFFILFILFSPTLSAAAPADSSLLRKAEKIHDRIISIDSHNDTPLRMMQPGFDIGVRHDPYKEHSKVDLVRMKEGRLDGAFFAVFVSQGKRDPDSYTKVEEKALTIFDTIHAAIGRHYSQAEVALSASDAERLKKADKRAVYIGVENGYAIGKDLSLLDTLYRRGARYITLCHTKNNDICDSSTDTVENDGLSRFGKEVVKEMNRLGLIVDVSHVSDQSFFDVLAVSEAPVIASHSCARALCNNPRNLDDAMLGALAAHGGVIQMCILSDYVKTPDPNPRRDSARAALRAKYNGFDGLSEDEMKKARKEWYAMDDLYPQKLATVSDVADHIDHIVKMAGIDHVGIGTDFDGGGGVDGCYDVSGMKNITVELLRRGYTESDLKKIWGGNLLRVMREVEKIAREHHG
jgi:membrane dipeptidase